MSIRIPDELESTRADNKAVDTDYVQHTFNTGTPNETSKSQTEINEEFYSIIGDPSDPSSGTILERIDDLEEAVGDGGSVDERIDEAVENAAFLGADDGSKFTANFDPQADTVHLTQQSLSPEQKAQVKANIDITSDINSAISSLKSELNGDFTSLLSDVDEVLIVNSLPQTGQRTKVIYRVPNNPYPNQYSDYGWDGSQYILLATYPREVDQEPTASSLNLVESGGVKSAIDNVAFQSGEKVNETSIDDEPTAGSDNLVKSSGVDKKLHSLETKGFTISEGYINSSDEIVGTSLYHTDYISVDEVSLIEYHSSIDISDSNIQSYFYDQDKVPICRLKKPASAQIMVEDIPQNAAFVRISIRTIANFFVKFYDNYAKDYNGYSLYGFTYNDGYRNASLEIQSNSSYIYTSSIYVQAGSIFSIKELNLQTNIALLTKLDSNGNAISVIIRGSGSSQDYFYVFDEDCYVSISLLKSELNKIRIVHSKLQKYQELKYIPLKSELNNTENAVDVLEKNFYKNESLDGIIEKLVIGTNSFVSVPSSTYKVGYKQITTNNKVLVHFQRKNTYSEDARIGYVNNVSDVAAGNSLTILTQIPIGTTDYYVVIPQNKVLVFSYRVTNNVSESDSVNISIYNTINVFSEFDRINSIIGNTPTEYTGGDMTAFKRILCIGDSITYGAFNHENIEGETWVQPTGYSYPENLSRISGSEVVKVAQSGISSYGWYNYYSNESRVGNLDGFDCCIIFLGINDDLETLDTLSRNAFIDIISLIKTRNPQIKIFWSGMINARSYPSTVEGSAMYIKDQFIKSLYNELYTNDNQVFLLDMTAYSHLLDLEPVPGIAYGVDNWNMGHLSAYGYWRLAKDYYNYISYIMAKDGNDNVFRNIQFTGTDFYFH